MFYHPRANRETQLLGSVVAYEFKHAQRKSIGFSIGPDGLTVRAPKWVTQHQVNAALHDKSSWIIRKLGEAIQRNEQRQAQKIEWRDGTTFPFLGEPVTVKLDSRCTAAPRGIASAVLSRTTVPDATPVMACIMTLQLALPLNATPEQISASVKGRLIQQATHVCTERMNHFAPQLQVVWRKLTLSNARTRWGSARLDGSIRLNWRLIHYPQALLDYVVCHELSHLREMNHGPAFWETVRSVLPDYVRLRHQLTHKSNIGDRWVPEK